MPLCSCDTTRRCRCCCCRWSSVSQLLNLYSVEMWDFDEDDDDDDCWWWWSDDDDDANDDDRVNSA